MRTTVRMRFALLFAAMAFLIGALLLTVLMLVVWQRLQAPDLGPAVLELGGGEVVALDRRLAAHESARVEGYLLDTMDTLRDRGALALLGTTVIAAGTGWWAAGWVLRPARQVTSAARRVAQSHDLTERIGYDGPQDEIKELADIFDGVLGRSARVLDGQRRFVTNASHELRTPLAINRALVDAAIHGSGATAEVRRLGESLLLVNARHQRLIDGLLALAEGEQAVPDRSGFDLADVVEHVVDQASAEAVERGVTVHSAPQNAPTEGDPALVERLVQNLVENAIRHNLPDGEVWVTSRRCGGSVELTVANTGPTVPPYEMEAIFQPFRRLNGDRLGSEHGSGLGLSIVRAIAVAHDGTVTARPRDRGGLAVAVRLPYKEE
ncbi:two-component system sensor histidine kinase [Planomonospora sphaerica]|uniref:histidine kinase n=1 Tax=Planomonospora sphaerica TaxID=161355 RepID=A0A161LIZ8_9ACTN|nr:HAMP domain-containing sensor histidine kinase [Planomonospora sphaerica]GAT65537.1 two-component system sensor histidine kinase [Planomonospora sphaerica]